MSVLRTDRVWCDAEFSEDRTYRYQLTRTWELFPRNIVAFVGLNPSTADQIEDDPTIRRCMNYARSWGADGLVMLNIFAFRATDPRVMKRAEEPVGPLNDAYLDRWAEDADGVVACWGAHGDHLLRGRQVQHHLRNTCRDRLRVFGLTKDGHPKHPLYLAKTQRLERW